MSKLYNDKFTFGAFFFCFVTLLFFGFFGALAVAFFRFLNNNS